MNIEDLSVLELLGLHARVSERLRELKITRTSNNPTGDLAEFLFREAFGWRLSKNSEPHIDAVAEDGTRYQIKARRITRRNKSRQLGALRDFDGCHFHFLAAILFQEDFSISRAALIPYTVVKQRAKFVEHTNSHKFILHDDVWNASGVHDVTEQLRAVNLSTAADIRAVANQLRG